MGLASLLGMIVLGFGSALAQTPPATPQPPVYSAIDANGVDLFSGRLNLAGGTISVGEPEAGLSYTYLQTAPSTAGVALGTAYYNGSKATITLGDASEEFEATGVVGTIVSFRNLQGRVSTLTYNQAASVQTFTYTLADGSVATYWPYFVLDPTSPRLPANIQSLSRPNGEQLSYVYLGVSSCGGGTALSSCLTSQWRRPISITSNLGYQLHFSYQPAGQAWWVLKQVTAINTAVDYCAPTATTCSGLTQAWPVVNFTTTTSGSDALGNVTTSSANSIVRPSGASVTKTSTGVSSFTVTNGVGTWSYAWTGIPTFTTMTVTDPLGHVRTVAYDQTKGRVLSEKDALNGVTSYQYDTDGRVTRITFPEGNYSQYAYDARGNVAEYRRASKTPGTPADIVTTASYDAVCANPKTCNKPNYVINPRGYRTDYTYDPVHGGTLTSTAPAGPGGVRPQERFSYTQLPSYTKDSAGSLVQSGSIWKLTGTSKCVTLATCAGSADELTTSITYTGSPNLRPLVTTEGSGDGALTATTTLTYDPVGNLKTIDGPIDGAADTTRNHYDALRRLVGVVEPSVSTDQSQLRNRAIRTTYDVDGRQIALERGTVTNPSDAAWPGMTVLQQALTRYDIAGRVTHRAVSGGGVLQTVTQNSYDNANRLTCTAERLNPAAFGVWPALGSLPSSACALGVEGPDGPDRIVSNTYDDADRLTTVLVGFGTTAQKTERAATYNANGTQATLADGKGNLTTYVYDGFDRLTRARLPNPSGGGSSTTDYENYSFDAASNLTLKRRRDGNAITYGYDALGRLVSKSGPLLPSSTYGHDNLGRVTTATAGSLTTTMSYDVLSRQLTETGPLGEVSYQYDAAGRRLRMTWPDGFKVTYRYNLLDELTAIWENGSSSYLKFSYDDLGRRTRLVRGLTNIWSTSYGYDPASRLASVQHTFPNAASNQTLAFTYSAAGEVRLRTNSNSAYAAPAKPAITQTYTLNGRNQVVAVGAATVGYDARGNLTNDGAGKSFGYDLENRLTSGSGGAAATLAYDPLDRLYRTVGATDTRFLYDGQDLIAEYDAAGALLRRYVHGPGNDEPLVWYDGVDLNTRRWLVADNQGSITAIADVAGVVTTINTYDEYGVPAASNEGRFQFTGQTWLPEVQLYHYKARVYSPGLGRFLQTDPIGTEDDVNLYAYAGGDPVNASDPAGTANCTSKGCQVTVPGFVKPLVDLWNMSVTIYDAANSIAQSKVQAQTKAKEREIFTYFHGASNKSVMAITFGELDISAALRESRLEQAVGFYMTPDPGHAQYFASRSGSSPAILQIGMTKEAQAALMDAGGRIGVMNPGGTRERVIEFYIPPTAFGLFNSLRRSGEINLIPHFSEEN